MSLTMPTVLLRWDPDLQPGIWSSEDPQRGSILQARDQHHTTSNSPSQTEALWTAISVILFLPWTKNTGELQVTCPIRYSAYFLQWGAFFGGFLNITLYWHEYWENMDTECENQTTES